MELFELVFFTALMGVIIITLVKLSNILNEIKMYDWKMATLLFVGVLLSWATTFYISIVHYTVDIVLVLYRMSTFLFLLNVLFYVVETIKLLSTAVENTQRQRYTPERTKR